MQRGIVDREIAVFILLQNISDNALRRMTPEPVVDRSAVEGCHRVGDKPRDGLWLR